MLDSPGMILAPQLHRSLTILGHNFEPFLMKVTSGISRQRNWGDNDPSMQVFISVASQPFKVRAEVLGNENIRLVSIAVSI